MSFGIELNRGAYAAEGGLEGTEAVNGCDYIWNESTGYFSFYERDTGIQWTLDPDVSNYFAPDSSGASLDAVECDGSSISLSFPSGVQGVTPTLLTSTGQLGITWYIGEAEDPPNSGTWAICRDTDLWILLPALLRNAYCDITAETTQYFASIGPSTLIDEETGLIRQSTFVLDWNNLDDSSTWSDSTKVQYNKFEDGELSGSMTPLADIIILHGTTRADYYITWSALNTGTSQRDPTVESTGWSITYGMPVTYGSVEEDAIKAKYKRYSGADYKPALNTMIDSIVQQVVDASIRTRSQYNFRKIDSNVHFREENTTIFAGDETTTEMESDVATATTTMTTTSTSTGGY